MIGQFICYLIIAFNLCICFPCSWHVFLFKQITVAFSVITYKWQLFLTCLDLTLFQRSRTSSHYPINLNCTVNTLTWFFLFFRSFFFSSLSLSECKHVCSPVLFTLHDASSGGGSGRRKGVSRSSEGETRLYTCSAQVRLGKGGVWARQVQLAAFTPRSKIIIRFRLVLFPLGRRQDPQPGSRHARRLPPLSGVFRKEFIGVVVMLEKSMHTHTYTYTCGVQQVFWAEV